MIDRKIFKQLEKELTKKQITALIGARQIGKTTSLKRTFELVKKEAIFLTFDDLEILNLFENNIKLFIEQYINPYKYIFIDEFQYAKQGGKQLKFIYDTNWKKIFISGSSKPELAIHSLSYLVGRISIIEMFPLTFEEFVNYKSPNKKILFSKQRNKQDFEQLKNEFNEFITFGAYPEVVIEKNFEEKKLLLRNIIQTYLFKEIKDVLGFKEHYLFENILRMLAIQNGKLIKKTSLSQNLDLNWNKVSESLAILEKTGLIISIKPFHTNKAKEIVKTPKIYFHDLGFVNALLKNFEEVNFRTDKGEIYESFVLQELIKNNIIPKFWNKQQSEIDFVIEQNQEIIAIEVKSKLKKVPLSTKMFLKEYKTKKVYVLNQETDKKIKEIELLNLLNITFLTKKFNQE